jgi:hypothetical protein
VISAGNLFSNMSPITTLIDSLPINQVNGPTKRFFKCLLHIEEDRDIQLNVRLDWTRKSASLFLVPLVVDSAANV